MEQNFKLNKTNKVQLFSFATLIILIVFIMISIPRLGVPFILAYLFTMILRPVSPFFIKLGIPKDIALIILVSLFFLVLIYPIVQLVPDFIERAKSHQTFIPMLQATIDKKFFEIQRFTQTTFKYNIDRAHLDHLILTSTEILKKMLMKVPQFLAVAVEWFFLIPIFMFFMVRDGRKIRTTLLHLCPNFLFEKFYQLIFQFQKKLSGYIFAKFIEASIVGMLILIGLLIIDIEFAFILALVAAVTNIIPYLGPVIGMIPAIGYAYVVYGSSAKTLAVLGLYLGANAIDLAIVFPILVSKIVDLHPLVVVTSVIIGSQYFGVAGMIISIPLAAAAKLIFQQLHESLYS
jgi:putative permease